MTHSTVFLTCGIHRAHKKFADFINARIITTPFFSYFFLIKTFRVIEIFFPIIAFFYSLFIYIKEDIVLVEGSGMLHIAAFLKLKQPRLKIIYLDADTFFYDMYKNNKKPKIFKYNLNTIDGIISVSETNKFYAGQYIKKPIAIAPPPPKDITHVDIERKNYGLYVGRLDPEKNIHQIINFFIQCPHLEKLVIIGNGVYRDDVKKKSEENPKIQYLGTIDNIDELSRYYYSCKFFLNFSEYDSYPCTILEAALAECFPIMPRHIGNSCLFDDLFVFKDSNSFEEINKKIDRILSDEKTALNSLKRSSQKILTDTAALKNFSTTLSSLMQQI